MFWSKKSNVKKEELERISHTSKVEVVAHKRATKKAVDEAKQVNKKLNNLLVENGFTLKIYLAAGGKHPQNKK